MKTKRISETVVIQTQHVLPNDTNSLGNLFGGQLLSWMDVSAAISAGRCSNRICVTASVDSVDFKSGIRLGEVVVLEARVTRCFTTSMEVRVDVWVENISTGERRHTNSAYYTFVAVDGAGQPIPVNQVQPETPQEQEWYDGALRRRELRMILSGRLKPQDASSLVALFMPEQAK